MVNKRKSKALVLALMLICLASLPAWAGVEMQSGVPSPTIASMDVPTQSDPSNIDTPTNADTTTVGFGGKQWKVIGYKADSGVYKGVINWSTGGGTEPNDSFMTLLLASGYTYLPDTTFGSDYVYNNSVLKSKMGDAYDALRPAEQGLVLARDLSTGVYNYTDITSWCDGVMTTEVTGARFWPLSTREASYVPTSVRVFSPGWWLRSPGDNSILAAYVYDVGSVFASGLDVDGLLAVRPAFNLRNR